MALPCTEHCTLEKNLLSHPCPSPSAPAGSSGSNSLTVADCSSSARRQAASPRATQLCAFHPKDGLLRLWARRREAGGNLLYPSLSSRAMYSLTLSLAILSNCSWRLSSHSRMPGCQIVCQSGPQLSPHNFRVSKINFQNLKTSKFWPDSNDSSKDFLKNGQCVISKTLRQVSSDHIRINSKSSKNASSKIIIFFG